MFKTLFFIFYVFTSFNLHICPEADDEVKTGRKEHYQLKLKRWTSTLSELRNLGEKLCREKKYSEAIRAFNDAINVYDEDRMYSYQDRGKCYAKMGKVKSAISDFEKAVKLQSYEGESRRLLAGALFDSGDYDGAIENTLHLFQHEIVNLGKKLCSMRQTDKVMDLYKKLIIKYPDTESYIARGNCHIELGNMDEALSDFQKAVDLDKSLPKEQKPGYNRVLACFELFNLGRMTTQELSSLDDVQLQALANKLIEKIRYNDCITCLSTAIEKYPKNAVFYRRRGFAYAMKLDHKNSIPDYKKAIELDGSHVDSWLDLVNALTVVGHYLEAKQYLDDMDANVAADLLADRSYAIQKIRERLYVKLETTAE